MRKQLASVGVHRCSYLSIVSMRQVSEQYSSPPSCIPRYFSRSRRGQPACHTRYGYTCGSRLASRHSSVEITISSVAMPELVAAFDASTSFEWGTSRVGSQRRSLGHISHNRAIIVDLIPHHCAEILDLLAARLAEVTFTKNLVWCRVVIPFGHVFVDTWWERLVDPEVSASTSRHRGSQRARSDRRG